MTEYNCLLSDPSMFMIQSEQRSQQSRSRSSCGPEQGFYGQESFPKRPGFNSQFNTSEEHAFGQQEIACPNCSQLFPNYFLRSHMSECHGKTMPYSCKLCSRGYLSYQGLYYHMASHNGNAKKKCPVCGKTFSRNFTLNRHIRDAHSGKIKK